MAWLQDVAKMLWAATHYGKAADTLAAQKKAAQATYPIAGIPQRWRDKATSVYDRCCDVAKGALEPDDAKEIIVGISGLEKAELDKLDEMKKKFQNQGK